MTDSPLAWTEDDQPRSRLYGDVYFSAEDGLAESRAVFLQGCDLPARWAGRTRFVVGELGFGTGLNILALLDLWRRDRPPGARLHVFSVEAHPITAEDAARALAHWPEIADLTRLLIDRWPGQARGVHRVDLPELDATVDLAVMEVEDALSGWLGQADAWFLDGFSPALNPAMWRDEVLALVAARTAPGGTAATFTVAGHVRRGLAAAGFEVAKRPGFGRKRERLEAVMPGAPQDERLPRVAIVGGGVAGASAARAFAALGIEAQVLERARPGAGGSGNPAALVTPRIDAGLGAPARLFAGAFSRAVELYRRTPSAVIAQGVLQRAQTPRDAARFAKVVEADIFEQGAMALADEGLQMHLALTIDPAAVLSAWLPAPRAAEVASLVREDEAWRLLDAGGDEIAHADVVVLAAAQASEKLCADLPLSPVRGQASWSRQVSPPPASAWGGYAVPLRDGMLFGATHDRGDEDVDVREADHRRNIETLAAVAPRIAETLSPEALEGRAAVRATTPDRLPIAGDLAPGLFALTGFGSRGFSLAPLLAEHVAALAVGAPSPLPQSQAEIVAPQRFARRAERRGRS